MVTPDFFIKHAGGYAISQSHATGEDLLSLLKNLPDTRDAVSIDLATGTGFTAVRLAERSRFVIALDKTKEMMNEARRLALDKHIGNVVFIEGNVESVPFLSDTFDFATCRRAAHHFPDKEKFLSETYRILKTGGYFGFADMVAPSVDVRDLFNDLERLRDHSHYGAETIESWLEKIQGKGFEIVFSELLSERVSFEKWLYPVELTSQEGKECIEFLKRNETYFREKIDFDGKSFIKSRGVVISRKS